MAIYKLLKIHPDSVWADPEYTIEGMIFQSSELPTPFYSNKSDVPWVRFDSVRPINGTNITLDTITIYGCTVKRLFA